ncbi:MAG: hypothetical protein IJ708_13340, partial [Clostridia bacterium]|nr:hypothetical protein [Clostridia bacterium]
MDQERNQNPAARSLLIGISSLYAYIYCLIVSNALTSMPVFGGAMYLCGQVALEFFSTAVGPAASLLPDRLRKWRRAILAVLMVMNLFLIVIYPIRLSSFQLWTVLVVVVAMLLRDEGARRLLQARRKGRLREVWFWFLLTLAHVLPAVAVLSDFMYNLGTNQALTMFVAYLLADALSIYVQISEALSWDDPMRDENEVAMVSEIRSRLGKANAFRTYQALSSAIVISLVSTVVLMYTYLLFSGENMLVQLGFTVLTTFLTSVAANLVFRGWMRRKNRQPNPTYVMLVGLLFWFGGLNAFDGAVMLRSKTTLNMYICLASCTVGTTLCLTSLNWMEQAIENVVRFAEGNNLSGFRMVRAAHTEMARLLGDMLALVIITVMFAISGHGPQALEDVVSHLQPILILPCLIMIFIAVICTFRFPLSTRNMDKLARFLHLREEGKENKAL